MLSLSGMALEKAQIVAWAPRRGQLNLWLAWKNPCFPGSWTFQSDQRRGRDQCCLPVPRCHAEWDLRGGCLTQAPNRLSGWTPECPSMLPGVTLHLSPPLCLHPSPELVVMAGGHTYPSPAALVLPSMPPRFAVLGPTSALPTPLPLSFLPTVLALFLPTPSLGSTQLPEPSLATTWPV